MALEKRINPVSGTFSSANDLEIVETNRVALKPRTAEGAIISLMHFDDINEDVTYYGARRYSESAYNDYAVCSYIQWETTTKKFGAAAAKVYVGSGIILLPYDARWNNLTEFTIDIFVNFLLLTGTRYILNELHLLGGTSVRWALTHVATELSFVSYNSAGTSHTLTTSGLGLTTGTWYHIRLSYRASGDGSSSAKISVNEAEVAATSSARLLPTVDITYCPQVRIGGYSRGVDAGGSYFTSAGYFYTDEFVMYPTQLASTYTMPTAAIAPFATSCTITLTIDSGTNGTVWDQSTKAFDDETDFDSEAIKIESDADDENTPAFSGTPLTLTADKALSDKTARYYHQRFTLTSDGDTKITLWPGSIEAAIPQTAAITQPTLDSFVRDGDSGRATVSNVAGGTTCKVYAIGIIDDETITLVGSRSGAGDIDLNLSAYAIPFFGVDIPVPTKVFAVSELNDYYSAPSAASFPNIWDSQTSVTMSGLSRSGNQLTFTISGLPAEDDIALILWTDTTIKAASVTGNGQHTITVNADKRFTFICMGLTSEAGLVGASTVTETAFSVNAPTLNSLTNVGDGDAITLNITPPAAGDYTACQIYYRKINTTAWTAGTTYTGVQGIAGTVNQTGLDDNYLYEFYVRAYKGTTYSDGSGIKRIWCYSGAQPLNEMILDEIKTTLEGITTGNGYGQTIRQVENVSGPQLVEFHSWPSIELWYSEDKDENELMEYSECNLRVFIRAYTDEKSNPRQALAILAADIQKALMVDYTRGGLVIDTEVQSLGWGFNKKELTPSGEIELMVGIKYRHLRSNPYLS